jgi:hypothetical protein
VYHHSLPVQQHFKDEDEAIMAYGTNEYRKQQASGASNLHLVVMAYDVAILACERRDMARAGEAVTALRSALDLKQGEPAMGLFRLYQWCLDCIHGKDFAGAQLVLRGLRESWASVEKRQSAVTARPDGAVSYVSVAY